MNESTNDTIMTTMVGPLYARAYYGKKYPEIFADPAATSLIQNVKAQHPDDEEKFRLMEELVSEFLGLTLLTRAKILDDAINEYIQQFPESTIVNLGCGLDNPFPRVDNGSIQWYDLDLPAAIEYRLRLIPETARSKCISNSIFDTNWFNDIIFSEEEGIFFIAGGLFGYFKEEQISSLLKKMAQSFKGGELIFDVQSSFGNRVVNRQILKQGVPGLTFKLAIANPSEQVASWSDKLEVLEWFPLFSKISMNKSWKLSTRILMKLTNFLAAGKFIHLRFSAE